MEDQSGILDKWEEAYQLQAQDAVVGRLFRGVVHNLNGVIQAFSMQSELFGMMFSQADEQIRQILNTTEGEARERVEKLQTLLQQRAVIAEHMVEKVHDSRNIVGRVLDMASASESEQEDEVTLNTLIQSEVTFLCADLFFKHKVEKELKLADDMPPMPAARNEVRRVVSALIQNAIDAMRASESPRIMIETGVQGDGFSLSIQDSGCGIADADMAFIYDPFFSTKENHPGLGLYFVKKMVDRYGGEIKCESAPGLTCFTLTIPSL
ncbi:MAG: HAMP domain-containing histidine kinase [Desulfobulbaceae bacterium]|nr:HAMP domain-containing histidine kinase [Desulfobulbaceae bacterium]